MPTVLATIAYDGTGFAGWQRQAAQRTVQGVLEQALERIGGAPVSVRAAGRTDAGVHARGQRASFVWARELSPERLLAALGALLPDDVSVLRVELRPDGYDARRGNIGKRYVYRLHTAPYRPLFERRYVWHRRLALDEAAMAAAAAALVGEHDFESFRSAGAQEAHARRCVWRCAVERAGDLLQIEVRGNAFVRGMVRAIAGTLVDVGRGRIAPGELGPILAARDRSAAGVTAPACGLTLEQVYLPEEIEQAQIPDWASWPGFRRPPGGRRDGEWP
ncbi:MAG: tRNA pseudouridine(38-40) synthase TruA [Deltaproteobacteria bacterium]|nr:tRNA pseudouridine(38-40) synthase TruA [Deltaproteobacteria bacterium]